MVKRSSSALSHWYHFVENFNTSALDFYRAVEDAISARDLPEDVSTERVTYKEGGLLSAKREYLRMKRGQLVFDIGAAPYGNGYFFSWWLARKPRPALGWIVLLGLVGLGYLFLLLLSFNQTLAAILEHYQQYGQLPEEGGGCYIFWVILLTPFVIYILGRCVHAGVFGPEELVIEAPIVGWWYVFLFGPNTYYRQDTAAMFQESVRRAVGEVIQGLFEEQGLKALAPDELKPQSSILKS